MTEFSLLYTVKMSQRSYCPVSQLTPVHQNFNSCRVPVVYNRTGHPDLSDYFRGNLLPTTLPFFYVRDPPYTENYKVNFRPCKCKLSGKTCNCPRHINCLI